jgi:hypothetical protein
LNHFRSSPTVLATIFITAILLSVKVNFGIRSAARLFARSVYLDSCGHCRTPKLHSQNEGAIGAAGAFAMGSCVNWSDKIWSPCREGDGN